MARVNAAKSAELEAFWRSHLEDWAVSELNQREYCEAHGLPLKRFGNWRAKLGETIYVPRHRLLYRRGGRVNHMADHMVNKEIGPVTPGYIPSGHTSVPDGRRNFSEGDKRRIVNETCKPENSVAGVARKYNLDIRMLFRWKQMYGPPAECEQVVLAPVKLSDHGEHSETAPESSNSHSAVVVEREAAGVEISLKGGRRVRFAADMEPAKIQALIILLEGASS